MSKVQRATAPDPDRTGWPPGIPYIIGNEGCERFSYYGMKAILFVYLAWLMTSRNWGAMLSSTPLAADAGLWGLWDWMRTLSDAGNAADGRATEVTHLFNAGVYAVPMIGALIADRFAGKYNTIFYLSLVYCAGHACMAIFDGNLEGTYVGLCLIAVGSGGIKPCVSANVGDQFGKSNWHLTKKVYQAFYFIINFGSFFSTLITPVLYRDVGPWAAFGLPGVLMFIATFWFWLGRNKFVRIPPRPGGAVGLLDVIAGTLLFGTVGHLFFTAGMDGWKLILISIACFALGLTVFMVRQNIQEDDGGFLAMIVYPLRKRIFGAKGGERAAPDGGGVLKNHWLVGTSARRFGEEAAEGPLAVFRIISVFLLISIFWALFDQHSSTWVKQAKDLDTDLGFYTLDPSQVSFFNPLIVMLLIPLFTFVVFPALEKTGLRITHLRKMTAGMLIAAVSFCIVAWIQIRIDAGEKPHVNWQFLAYIVITIAEVLVSAVGLEFAYTQAPRRMKSTIMGFWLLTVSLGNVLVAVIEHSLPKMSDENFFWLFAALMAGAGVLFGLRAAFYTYRDYPQDSGPPAAAVATTEEQKA